VTDDIDPFPAQADEPQHLDPRVIQVHDIGTAIFLGALYLATFAGSVISAIFGDRGRWRLVAVAAVGGLVVGGLLWLLGRRFAHAVYRHTSYVVSRRGLEIRRGVWWQHVISVPRSRIQHADVSQGPLQRAFELATLVLYTAGAQHAKIELEGLAFSTAVALRHDLLRGDSAIADAGSESTTPSAETTADARPPDTPATAMRPSAPRDDDDDELE
jgi:membrane protein YdbS with pleckstrin-like domain